MGRNPECFACGLCNVVDVDGRIYRKVNTPCLWGEGPTPCHGMIVGMNPGEEEDRVGRPFVGPSGKLLNSLLQEVGLNRDELYVTNVVKGKTPYNREPTLKEVKGCRPYLVEEFELVRPRVVCALGNVALRALTGRGGIVAWRGKELVTLPVFGNVEVVATFHPSAALRYPKYRPLILEDLNRFKRALEGSHESIPVHWKFA